MPTRFRGWDNAKKGNGRTRHIAVDTAGLLLAVVITVASVQDRHGAMPLLGNLHRVCRHTRLVGADAGYADTLATWAATLRMRVQFVTNRDRHACKVAPRRWVVETTFARTSKHRHTTPDDERLPASHQATIT